MSYDVIAYSNSEAVPTPEDLVAFLGGWSIGPVSMTSNRPLPRARPFPSSCLVVGWKPKKSLPDVQALLKARDEPALNDLYSKSLIGSCPLNIKRGFKLVGEDLEEAIENASPAELKALKAARVRYSTYSSAGRSDLSIELQIVFCAAIARAHGGVVEDPQLGLYKIVKPA